MVQRREREKSIGKKNKEEKSIEQKLEKTEERREGRGVREGMPKVEKKRRSRRHECSVVEKQKMQKWEGARRKQREGEKNKKAM